MRTKAVLKVLATVLVSAVLLELTVRVSGYSDRYVYDPVYCRSDWPQEIPYVHRAGLRDALAQGNTRFSTDALGLRSTEPGARPGAKVAGEYRVAVLGDSVTFGQGVATPDTFCAALDRHLAARRPDLKVRVFNFGVCGYSVKEMAATLRRRASDVQPDLVVLAIIFSDFELGRCGRVDRWGYLHNWKVTSYDQPDALRYLILRKFHLTYWVRDLAYRLGVAGREQGARAAAAEGELPVGGTIPRPYSFITAMAETARLNGWSFLMVTLPSIQSDGSEFDVLRAQFARDGLDQKDFSRLTTQYGIKEYRVSRYDGHPGGLVHHRIGTELAGHIESRFLPPAADPLPGTAQR